MNEWMHQIKNSKYFSWGIAIVAILVCVGLYFGYSAIQDSRLSRKVPERIFYSNADYGFMLYLPGTWNGVEVGEREVFWNDESQNVGFDFLFPKLGKKIFFFLFSH